MVALGKVLGQFGESAMDYARAKTKFRLLANFVNANRMHIPWNGRLWAITDDKNCYTWRPLILGRFEKPERKIAAALVASAGRPQTIIDLGSNIGVVARTMFESHLTDGGRMICVEAAPRALEALNINMARAIAREPKRTYTIEPVAISRPGQQFEVFSERADLGQGVMSQQSSELGAIEGNQITVPAMSLGELLAKHKVASNYFLSCDIEGGEIPLLYEDADALRLCNLILIELHPSDVTGNSALTPAVMKKQIESLGFECIAHNCQTYGFKRVVPQPL